MKDETARSDYGREYCGREDRHPYELFLQLEEIEHRKTKVGHPQSNGSIERPSPRAPRRTLEEMQTDLERLPQDPRPEPSALRPRRGRANPVSGRQEGDPEAPEPEEVNQEGGENRRLKR